MRLSRVLTGAIALGLLLVEGPYAETVDAQESSEVGQASVGGLLSSPAPRPPKSLDPELDAVAAQLGELAAADAYKKDEVVRRAVDQGKRAVLLAARALAASDAETAARKKQLAQAALALATRAAARREETRAEAAAEQSATQAEQAKAQAAVLLEQARARLTQLRAEAP